MPRKGRPAGSKSRYCLIKDELILPYEIHFDSSTSTFLKVIAENQKTDGYYTTVPHLLRSILREKHVPQGKEGETYTLKEYVESMNKLTNAMAKLLIPPHHKLKFPTRSYVD
tara:strand:- start:718 stop:1053 length:336 start_codon:yes stop_codon:yes gene_type:complete